MVGWQRNLVRSFKERKVVWRIKGDEEAQAMAKHFFSSFGL